MSRRAVPGESASMGGMRRYVALGAEPGTVAVGIPSVAARLPLGMTNLALLLAVHASSGSFGFAALAAACFAVASGASSPVRGRLVDRAGAAPVLAVTGVLQSLALCAVAWAAHGRGNAAATLLAALAAGALLPPVGPVARAVWQRLPDGALRQAAFSLDALLLQVIYYTAGPPLVAVLAAASSPDTVLYVVAALTLGGTLAMAAARQVRDWPLSRAPRSLSGALAIPGLLPVLAVVLGTAAATSAAEVGATGFAVARHAAGLSGLLLALFGAGSIAGGLFQGGRDWRSPLRVQYRTWVAALCVLLAPLAAAPGVIVLGGLLIIAGLAVAPASSVQFALVGTMAREGTLTEAFTWLFAAQQAGGALGSAAIGAVVQAAGPRPALLVPCALALVALALTWCRGGRGRGGRRGRRA